MFAPARFYWFRLIIPHPRQDWEPAIDKRPVESINGTLYGPAIIRPLTGSSDRSSNDRFYSAAKRDKRRGKEKEISA